MVTESRAQQPNEYAGNKITPVEYDVANAFVKEIKYSAQKQKWKGIRKQVHVVAMNHGGSKDSYQSFPGSGFNTQISKINPIIELYTKGKPHYEYEPEGNN